MQLEQTLLHLTIMGKSRGTEAKLARLNTLHKEVVSPALVEELRKLLADSSNLVVAEAAGLATTANLREFTPRLAAGFDRFMVDPEKTDRLCRAKIALVQALDRLEYDSADLFLRAIKHVQLEPGWGQAHDSAGPLRGAAGFALARLNYPGCIDLLVDLLADPEKPARMAAVGAISGLGSVAAIPLLRLKARLGDKEPEVTCECLSALLRRDADSLPLVAEFLHDPSEAIQEGAALALGETRRPGAFEILRTFFERPSSGSLQETVLLAISMLRSPEAVDFLLPLLAAKHTARASLSALAIHRHNDKIREAVRAAVTQAKDPVLQKRFEEKFKT